MPTDEWWCFTDEEAGPFDLPTLQQRVAEGTLRGNDLVRRGAMDWRRVDTVPALRPAASPSAMRSDSPPRRGEVERSGLPVSGWRWLLCLPPLLLGLQGIWWWAERPRRFPAQGQDAVRIEVPTRLAQMRSRRSRPPTLPSLVERVAVPAPGFADVAWMKSPSLSQDLCVIAYLRYGGAEASDDLWLAERATLEEPFGQHRPLTQLNTPGRESHPALAPDGLTLAWSVAGSPARLWMSRRVRRDLEFSTATPVQLVGDPAPDQHHDGPQFVDSQTLVWTSYNSDFQQRVQRIATFRSDNQWAVAGAVPLADAQSRNWLSTGLRRAYLLRTDGLWLTARAGATKEFVTPELLLPGSQLGPELTRFDDTFWISPAEDLLFYCSPGGAPGAAAQDHRLWMMRF